METFCHTSSWEVSHIIAITHWNCLLFFFHLWHFLKATVTLLSVDCNEIPRLKLPILPLSSLFFWKPIFVQLAQISHLPRSAREIFFLAYTPFSASPRTVYERTFFWDTTKTLSQRTVYEEIIFCSTPPFWSLPRQYMRGIFSTYF